MARLRGEGDAALEHFFRERRIIIRLEEAFADVPDARETFLFAVNQALRFCQNVAVSVPARTRELIAAGDNLAIRVHGPDHRVGISDVAEAARFGAVVNVGTEMVDGLPWVTVNSTGWIARVATAKPGMGRLLWSPGAPNPIGALAAACLGVGRAFLFLVGKPLVTPPLEISLFTYEADAPGLFLRVRSFPQVPFHSTASS